MQHHSGALLALLYKGLKEGFPKVGSRIEIRMKQPTYGLYEITVLENYGNRFKFRVEGLWSCEATIYLESQRRVRMEHNHAYSVEECDIYPSYDRIDNGTFRSENGTTYRFESKRMDPTRVEFTAQNKQGRSETKEYEFVR